MATKRTKPGTKKIINGKKMVMGFNGRWVSQATYIRQRTERANIKEPKSTRTPNVSGERTRIKPKPVPRGSVGKELPGKGQSTASSGRSRYQRGLRRDRLAKNQLSNFGRAMGRQLKQDSAKSKLSKAAKGTKGNRTRYSSSGKPPKALPPGKKGGEIRQKGGPLAKRPPSKGSALTRTGVDKVRVESRTPKALPPGKKGGPLTQSGIRKVRVSETSPDPRNTMKTTKPGRKTPPNQNRALKPGVGGNQTKPQGPRQRVRVGGTRPQQSFGPKQNPKQKPKVKPMPKDSPQVKKALNRMRAGNTNEALTGGKGLKGGMLTTLVGAVADQLTPIIADAVTNLAIRPLIGAMTGRDLPNIDEQMAGIAEGRLQRPGAKPTKSGPPAPQQSGSQQFNQAMPIAGTGAMPSFTPGMNLGGEQLLNVPVKPAQNPATAMQQQPQRPAPVPQPPAAPQPAPQPVPQQQPQPAPQPQMQQPPQDANEGLRMWQEIHGNAQKSVIDGMNIVDRYRKKMGAGAR